MKTSISKRLFCVMFFTLFALSAHAENAGFGGNGSSGSNLVEDDSSGGKDPGLMCEWFGLFCDEVAAASVEEQGGS